jgi:hypothetical protein
MSIKLKSEKKKISLGEEPTKKTCIALCQSQRSSSVSQTGPNNVFIPSASWRDRLRHTVREATKKPEFGINGIHRLHAIFRINETYAS